MRWPARRLVVVFGVVAVGLLSQPLCAVDDRITLYTPPFEGPAALGASVATILNLQIWQTLRGAPSPNPKSLLFGQGVVVWGRPLKKYSHNDAEARAKEISLLAQFVFWGKVYTYGEGAIAQTNLSIPDYRDFREAHPERWIINIRGPDGVVKFATDIPQRRYSFEPIVLTEEVIRRYSRPAALLIYASPGSQEVIGAIGNEFTAIEQREEMVKVRSGGKTGWVRLPQLSRSRSEVVEFVGGVIRIFRGDWAGAEALMSRVIENTRTPNELRTDAYLYKGLAASQQNQVSEEAFSEARKLSPYSKRCIVYAVMGKLSDYWRAQGSRASAEEKRNLLREARRLLEENEYLFEPNDSWVSEVFGGLERLESAP